MQSEYLLLITWWAIYLFFHSFLAADRVKRNIQNALSISPRIYRFLYSFWSVMGLVYLLYVMASIPPKYLIDGGKYLRYAGLVLTSYGVIVIHRAFKKISIQSFLGLKGESTELIVDGMHKHVRHPIYSGIILIQMGLFAFIPTLAVGCANLVIAIYLPIGIYLEEQKLIQIFGQKYLDYRSQVPAIIPRLF